MSTHRTAIATATATAILETLEQRRLFTAAWLQDGVLHVTGGDTRGDVIRIRLDGDFKTQQLTRCRVAINQRPYVSFPVDQVNAINVRGGDGSDFISCLGSGFSGDFRAIPITLIGGNGNDTIRAGGTGDVLMLGNSGDDWLQFSAFSDHTHARIDGGAGDDIINGSNGDDLITGGGGTDNINAFAGNDTIFGGDARDIISGGAGNDLIFGGAGDDSLEGDDGIYGDDAIFGGDGNDSIQGWGGNDLLVGNAGDDNIRGGSYQMNTIPTLAGNDGEDRLYGGDPLGHDTLDGGNQTNHLYQGELPNLSLKLDEIHAHLPDDVKSLVSATA